MKLLLLGALMVLAGCATSAKIAEKPAQMAVASNKSPHSFAICVLDHIPATVYSLRNDGEHYWIVGQADPISPVVRWDFIPQAGGGSTAELRSSFHIGGSNVGKVKACA